MVGRNWRALSRNQTVPTTVTAAENSSGIAVDIADARNVAATGPITQISSCAVVSSANSARSPSPGTICGYSARTAGNSGGTEAPIRNPNTMRNVTGTWTKASASMLMPLIKAADTRVGTIPIRPSRRAVIGIATASPMLVNATTAPATAYDPVRACTCSRIASDSMPSGSRANSCEAVTLTTPGTRTSST